MFLRLGKPDIITNSDQNDIFAMFIIIPFSAELPFLETDFQWKWRRLSLKLLLPINRAAQAVGWASWQRHRQTASCFPSFLLKGFQTRCDQGLGILCCWGKATRHPFSWAGDTELGTLTTETSHCSLHSTRVLQVTCLWCAIQNHMKHRYKLLTNIISTMASNAKFSLVYIRMSFFFLCKHRKQNMTTNVAYKSSEFTSCSQGKAKLLTNKKIKVSWQTFWKYYKITSENTVLFYKTIQPSCTTMYLARCGSAQHCTVLRAMPNSWASFCIFPAINGHEDILGAILSPQQMFLIFSLEHQTALAHF